MNGNLDNTDQKKHMLSAAVAFMKGEISFEAFATIFMLGGWLPEDFDWKSARASVAIQINQEIVSAFVDRHDGIGNLKKLVKN